MVRPRPITSTPFHGRDARHALRRSRHVGPAPLTVMPDEILAYWTKRSWTRPLTGATVSTILSGVSTLGQEVS
jgi:hypothetical protein